MFNFNKYYKIAIKFVGLQTLSQIINIITGVAAIRFLSSSELAIYTIGFFGFTFLNMLADGGVGSAMTAIGAEVHNDSRKLARLTRDASSIRFRLGLLSSFIVIPLVCYQAFRLKYGFDTAISLSVMSFVYYNISVSRDVWYIILRLKDEYMVIQKAEIFASIPRLIFTIFVSKYLNSGLLILLLSVMYQMAIWLLARHACKKYISSASASDMYVDRIWVTVKQSMPGIVFYALQAQVSIILMGFFGKKSDIAGIGALSRIGLVYAIMSSMVTNVFAPKFALVNYLKLKTIYLSSLVLSLVFGATIFLMTIIFSKYILYVFGPEYKGLNYELGLVSLIGSVSFFGYVMGELNKSRAWMSGSWIVVPLTILVQCISLLFIDVTNIKGALIFSLISQSSWILTSAFQSCRGIRSAGKANQFN